MVQVTLVRACKLQHNGEFTTYRAGVHDLPEEIANHWWIQQHSDNPPPPITQPGTPAAIAAVLAARRREQLLAAATDQEVAEAADEKRVALRKRVIVKAIAPGEGDNDAGGTETSAPKADMQKSKEGAGKLSLGGK